MTEIHFKLRPDQELPFQQFLKKKNLQRENFGTTNEFYQRIFDEFLNSLLLDRNSLASNSPSGEQITSDVPLGMPKNPEKQKALEQLKQESYEVRELPPPPCNFCAKGRIDNKLGYQLVLCNDPRKYKKPTEIPLAACQNCWKRKEWGKEKREREAEEKGIEEPEEIEVPNCKERYLRYKGAENDPNAVHDFQKGENPKVKEGKKIYCMRFCEWKTLEWCIDCFKGGKSTSVSTDVSETEEGDGYQ